MKELKPIEEALRQLEDENRCLRDLVLSLSLVLLRTSAVHSLPDQNGGRAEVQKLMLLGEECFRCASLPGLKPPIAEGLQVAGNELMAKAVELDTKLQREKADKR